VFLRFASAWDDEDVAEKENKAKGVKAQLSFPLNN